MLASRKVEEVVYGLGDLRSTRRRGREMRAATWSLAFLDRCARSVRLTAGKLKPYNGRFRRGFLLRFLSVSKDGFEAAASAVRRSVQDFDPRVEAVVGDIIADVR